MHGESPLGLRSMKPAAASSNWTSRKRNEKFWRFWQTAMA
ncbi:hypothetical protein ACCUM_3844 [Candidatus Accumulibacter phosphatis]|uniref:Uncharacterized protein n=1 Tax=Candidatus Accumulibacter phosphatis TaxID=327160 RepID=A0A5S4ENB4_9PROT|nr:hypothetical protein ACCUM_3844 [Candidatus Accumulibacter phosphatis]